MTTAELKSEVTKLQQLRAKLRLMAVNPNVNSFKKHHALLAVQHINDTLRSLTYLQHF